MFGSIKIVMFLLITGIAGAGMYVMKLRSDNVILKSELNEIRRTVRTSQKN